MKVCKWKVVVPEGVVFSDEAFQALRRAGLLFGDIPGEWGIGPNWGNTPEYLPLLQGILAGAPHLADELEPIVQAIQAGNTVTLWSNFAPDPMPAGDDAIRSGVGVLQSC